jgi:hypothetical protein
MVKQLSVLIGALLVSSSALAAGVPVSHAIAAVGGTSASGVNFKVKQPLSPAWGMLTTLTGSGTATYNRNDTINLGSSGGGSTTNTITFTNVPVGGVYAYVACTLYAPAMRQACKVTPSNGIYNSACGSSSTVPARPTVNTQTTCSDLGYVYVYLSMAPFSSTLATTQCVSSVPTSNTGWLKLSVGQNYSIDAQSCAVSPPSS